MSAKRFVTVGLVMVACAGCGSATHHQATHHQAGATTTVTDRSNGSSVVLHVGDQLRVVLASTYWKFDAASKPDVARMDGEPVTRARLAGCVPGGGCGTETAVFAATKVGTTTVRASRTSCGEVLRCTDGKGRFVLVVVVK
jgi:hypothetical protein